MALVLADRVQQTGTANTTVSFTLSSSVTGFQSFSVIGDTNTTYYAATDTSGNWEVGIGTYSTTGPTLTRTTILASSNSGTAVTFSGTVNVFVTYPSSKSVNLDASGNVGIGTASPDSSNKLEVTGDIGLSWNANKFIGMKYIGGASYKMGLMLNDATRECKVWSQSSESDDKITFYTGSTPSERMRITSAGGVSFGSTGTAYGTSGQVLTSAGDASPTWTTPASGTVTSVAATVPSFLSVAGSPITTDGTLAITLATTPTNGQLLIGNGTGFAYSTLTAGSGITITNGAGSIEIASSGGGLTQAQALKLVSLRL